MSDSDVVGAMAYADRRLSSGEDHHTKHPLAVPLERLFRGSRNSKEVIGILADLIQKKAKRSSQEISAVEAKDMARVILGWFRSPRCRVCGGHGLKIIRGTTSLGHQKCAPCQGTGTIQLELLYLESKRELVRWAISRMELEAGLAAPAAMTALASKMDL